MPSPGKKAKKQVGTAKTWKKARTEIELELPSGNVCLVKRPGMPQLLAAGVLPDILTPIAEKAIKSGQGGVTPKDKDIEDSMMEEIGGGGMVQLMTQMGKITAYCVVEPPVKYHQRIKAAGQIEQIQDGYKPEWEDIPEDERDDDFLYTDDVDLDDQMFIFNFVVGGTANLVEFRGELNESVARLEAESGTKDNAS